jgi:hypothetical protein
MALPEDVPIPPGETHTFRIAKNIRERGRHIARENIPNPTKVHLTFVQLSFADGTGFNGTDAKPFPYRRDSEFLRVTRLQAARSHRLQRDSHALNSALPLVFEI